MGTMMDSSSYRYDVSTVFDPVSQEFVCVLKCRACGGERAATWEGDMAVNEILVNITRHELAAERNGWH